jgi:hypothetical protein
MEKFPGLKKVCQMDFSEFFKQVGWALLEWARTNRLLSSISAGVLVALVAYIVVPRLPAKTKEEPAASSTPSITIHQQSGDDSSCSNMAASGNGSITCSASPEGKNEPPKNK